jgi:hypothetical protein
MSQAEIKDALNTLNLSVGDRYGDNDIKDAWQILM